jgi:hypothetical protein
MKERSRKPMTKEKDPEKVTRLRHPPVRAAYVISNAIEEREPINDKLVNDLTNVVLKKIQNFKKQNPELNRSDCWSLLDQIHDYLASANIWDYDLS